MRPIGGAHDLARERGNLRGNPYLPRGERGSAHQRAGNFATQPMMCDLPGGSQHGAARGRRTRELRRHLGGKSSGTLPHCSPPPSGIPVDKIFIRFKSNDSCVTVCVMSHVALTLTGTGSGTTVRSTVEYKLQSTC